MATTMTKKNPAEKITYAHTFNALVEMLEKMNPDEVLATIEVSKDVFADLTVAGAIEKVNQHISKLNRKSSAPKKPSTASIQNAQYAELIVAFLTANADTGFTSAELAEIEGMPDGCSSSKITAIMRHVPEGAISVDKVKGKNVYFIPSVR